MSVIETATAPLAEQRANALLDVQDLRVTFSTPDGDVTAVNDLNFYPACRGNLRNCRRVRLRQIADRVCADGAAGPQWPDWRIGKVQWQ